MKLRKRLFCFAAAALGCAVTALGGELIAPPATPAAVTNATPAKPETTPSANNSATALGTVTTANTANPASAVTTASAIPAIQQPIQMTGATSKWDDPAPPTVGGAPAAATGTCCAQATCDGCGGCGGCDNCCGRCFQFVAAVEGTFFWPQFNRQFLSTTLTNSLGREVIESTAVNGSAEGRLLAAPRVTAGIQGECWGLVGRYWLASIGTAAFAPDLPNDPTYGVIGFEAFRAYTVDIELQRRFCWCNWDMYGFLGARYASLNDDRSLFGANSFGGPVLTAGGFAGQQFNGTGLTFGFSGMRPIWCDDSPWKAYFVNRYSTLWGNGVSTARTFANARDTNGSAVTSNGAQAGSQGDLFIAEVQLGLQWDCCCTCLPGRAFVRAGMEWQYWDTNYQAHAQSYSTALLTPGGERAEAYAEADDMRFSLIGLTIGAGIMF